MATPAIVCGMLTPWSNVGPTFSLIDLFYPGPTQVGSLSGNCLLDIVWTNNDATTTPTYSDNKTGTWTNIVDHSYSGMRGSAFTQANATVGIERVRSAFGINEGFCKRFILEIANLASTAVSRTTGTNDQITNVTDVTTTFGASVTAGDLVIHVVFQGGGWTAGSPTLAAFTAANASDGTTMTILAQDRQDGWCISYGIAATTATITLHTTAGTANQYSSMAIALKSGASGTIPTQTPRVLFMKGQVITSLGLGSGNIAYTNSYPAAGDLAVVQFGSIGRTMSTVSGGGGTWVQSGTHTGGGAAGIYEEWYRKNASGTNNQAAVTYTLTSGTWGDIQDYTFWYLDIIGSDTTTPQDVATVFTGGNDTTSTNGVSVTGASITPGQANTLIVGMFNEENHACGSVASPFVGSFPVAPENDSSINGASSLFEDGCAGLMYSTDVTAKTFKAVNQTVGTPPTGLGNWVNILSSWKAPAAGDVLNSQICL